MLRSKFPLPVLATDKIKPNLFGETRRFKLLPSHVTLPLSKTLKREGSGIRLRGVFARDIAVH